MVRTAVEQGRKLNHCPLYGDLRREDPDAIPPLVSPLKLGSTSEMTRLTCIRLSND